MRARIVSVVTGLLLCTASAFAQQGTASIGGKVADQGGGVLPGVTIVITNEDRRDRVLQAGEPASLTFASWNHIGG